MHLFEVMLKSVSHFTHLLMFIVSKTKKGISRRSIRQLVLEPLLPSSVVLIHKTPATNKKLIFFNLVEKMRISFSQAASLPHIHHLLSYTYCILLNNLNKYAVGHGGRKSSISSLIHKSSVWRILNFRKSWHTQKKLLKSPAVTGY